MNRKKPPPPPTRPATGRAVEALRTSLAVIMAATQNLRHYRDRLSQDAFDAVLNDIEQAARDMDRCLDEAAATNRHAGPEQPPPKQTPRKSK